MAGAKLGKHWIWIAAGAGAFILGIGVIAVAAYYFLGNSSSPRARLPRTATNIQEEHFDMTPDYIYLLTADMPAPDADKFIRDLGLTAHNATRKYADDTLWLSWNNLMPGTPPWWNPTRDLSSTYVKQDGHTWTFAKYEKGTLYYKSISH